MSTRERTLSLALAVAALVTLGACRQDMHDQPRVEPLGESDFFADGSGARPIPAHTVARGGLKEDRALHTGQNVDGSLVSESPLPVTRELLLHGRQRFEIYCAPCHGRTGDGDGMVVRRGYKQPSSFHVDRLRMAPIGYYYYVMTNGFGVMPSYAAQIPVEDRWAIIAYLRTLQLSRHMPASALAPEDRQRLDAPPAADSHAASTGH